MRAPGHVNGAFALEQAIDELADRLRIDPVDIRMRNLPVRDPDSGRPFASDAMRQAIAAATRAIGRRRRPRTPDPRIERWASELGLGRTDDLAEGTGMAITSWSAGGGPPAGAICQLSQDGSVTLLTGATDLGTGTRTALAQIVAEELGIRPSAVRVVHADTATCPFTFPSFGSLTIASSGPACRQAAHQVRVKLIGMAQALLSVPEERLELSAGDVRVRGSARPGVSIEALARSVPDRVIVGRGRRGPNPDLALHAFAAHACRVIVDRGTGRVLVTRYAAAHDSGRVINPLTWSSQVHGGVVMGLGYGLSEERTLDPNTGAVADPGFLAARLPTIADSPLEIEALDTAVECPTNDVGAKGIGEPPVIPPAAAVANAVARAIGIRIRTAPLDPRRVLEALSGEDD